MARCAVHRISPLLLAACLTTISRPVGADSFYPSLESGLTPQVFREQALSLPALETRPSLGSRLSALVYRLTTFASRGGSQTDQQVQGKGSSRRDFFKGAAGSTAAAAMQAAGLSREPAPSLDLLNNVPAETRAAYASAEITLKSFADAVVQWNPKEHYSDGLLMALTWTGLRDAAITFDRAQTLIAQLPTDKQAEARALGQALERNRIAYLQAVEPWLLNLDPADPQTREIRTQMTLIGNPHLPDRNRIWYTALWLQRQDNPIDPLQEAEKAMGIDLRSSVDPVGSLVQSVFDAVGTPLNQQLTARGIASFDLTRAAADLLREIDKGYFEPFDQSRPREYRSNLPSYQPGFNPAAIVEKAACAAANDLFVTTMANLFKKQFPEHPFHYRDVTELLAVNRPGSHVSVGWLVDPEGTTQRCLVDLAQWALRKMVSGRLFPACDAPTLARIRQLGPDDLLKPGVTLKSLSNDVKQPRGRVEDAGAQRSRTAGTSGRKPLPERAPVYVSVVRELAENLALAAHSSPITVFFEIDAAAGGVVYFAWEHWPDLSPEEGVDRPPNQPAWVTALRRDHWMGTAPDSRPYHLRIARGVSTEVLERILKDPIWWLNIGQCNPLTGSITVNIFPNLLPLPRPPALTSAA